VTINVARLPRLELAAGTHLYRIHPAGLGPWRFAGDKLGRFNPVAATTMGASYWAEDPLGAWVEKFRTRMDLAEAEAEVQLQVVSVVRSRRRSRSLTSRIVVPWRPGSPWR
jgi:hypothetical protein